jgi:hypothetical protein
MGRGTSRFGTTCRVRKDADGREEHTMVLEHDANAHELLNEATEWLQYARNVTQMLAELVHESDTVDCTRLSMTLEAIGAMTHRGIQCAAEAHARMHLTDALGHKH